MVMELLAYLFVSIAAVFVIVNPLTTAFIFSSLVKNASDKEKRTIARKATLTSTIILITFALLGGVIFMLFGITLAAFKIAGGIILFGIGMSMLKESDEKMKLKDGKVSEGIAVVPLAIPFISGPGSIALVMILTSEAPSPIHVLVVFAAVLITTIACYYSMVYSKYIINYLGETGKQIVSKLFGLILAVIAVQFVINGILDSGLI